MGLIDIRAWTEEPLIIQLHVVVALLGVVLGGYTMLARKGTARHKAMGRVFGALALATAGTSLFIHEIQVWGIWSPIHLLSVLTIFLIWRGVVMIRRGNVATHERIMVTTYLSGFIVAGSFALLPGRMSYEVFLEGAFERLTGSMVAAERLAWVLPALAIPFAIWVLAKGYRRHQTRASG